jgi:hypothetical protein
VRVEFAYDGGGLGKGGTVRQRRRPSSLPPTRPPTSAATPPPPSDDYGPKDSEFTGRIRWVQIDVDKAADDVDHLISPEECLRIAMARQ